MGRSAPGLQRRSGVGLRGALKAKRWQSHGVRPLIEPRELWREEKAMPGHDPARPIPRALYPERADCIVYTEKGQVRAGRPERMRSLYGPVPPAFAGAGSGPTPADRLAPPPSLSRSGPAGQGPARARYPHRRILPLHERPMRGFLEPSWGSITPRRTVSSAPGAPGAPGGRGPPARKPHGAHASVRGVDFLAGSRQGAGSSPRGDIRARCLPAVARSGVIRSPRWAIFGFGNKNNWRNFVMDSHSKKDIVNILRSLRERWQRSLLLENDPHPGIDWVENTMESQTIVFYSQLLPVIFNCVVCCHSNPTRIADIGACTGVGGDFTSKVITNLMGYSVETTCFDTSPYFKRLAMVKYPNIEYHQGDFFEYQDRKFDIAVCSHVIEHIPYPDNFVTKVVDKVNYFLIGYVPFKEVNLIPGHVNSFDETSIREMPGLIWARNIRSVGWRSANEEQPSCVIFICATKQAMKKVNISKLCILLDNEFYSYAIKN